MGRMQRTQIFLEPELAEQLDRLARRRGVSRAEIIRGAARAFVLRDDVDYRRPIFRIAGIAEGPGDDIAEEHDRILSESALSPDRHHPP